MNPQSRQQFDQQNRAEQARAAEAYHQRRATNLVSYAEAAARRFPTDWAAAAIEEPAFLGTRVLRDFPLDRLVDYIDWSPLFSVWELRGKYPKIFDDPQHGEEARKVFDDAHALLDQIVRQKLFTARGVYGFWPAAAAGDDIIVFGDPQQRDERARIHTLRQQWQRQGQTYFRALADFIAPLDCGRTDYLGAFAVTTGHGCAELVAACHADHDDYTAIMAEALADRLAEAFAECLHRQARCDWGYGRAESLTPDQLIREEYRGIRPAPGYPACPDHTEKRTLFDLLGAEEATGIELTETYAMRPAAAVCGMYFAHPQARYFAVDRITRDQVEDYARRKGQRVHEVERWLAPNLGYDPEP